MFRDCSFFIKNVYLFTAMLCFKNLEVFSQKDPMIQMIFQKGEREGERERERERDERERERKRERESVITIYCLCRLK
jgi:GTP1/Obg family GTP-binding protein